MASSPAATVCLCLPHLVLIVDLDLDIGLASLVSDLIRHELLVTLNLLVLIPGFRAGRGWGQLSKAEEE